jgi:hypothetical protein
MLHSPKGAIPVYHQSPTDPSLSQFLTEVVKSTFVDNSSILDYLGVKQNILEGFCNYLKGKKPKKTEST